jgi:hypothetical protein
MDSLKEYDEQTLYTYYFKEKSKKKDEKHSNSNDTTKKNAR